jgi:hypothetical protein
MPAAKPKTLITRAETKADQARRADAEAAMQPKTELTVAIPQVLRGRDHDVASRTWKRIVGLYGEVDGKIVTAFDQDLIVKYCLLEEECRELARMRKQIRLDWERLEKAANKMIPTSENIKDYVKLWETVNALFARFQGMDARLDGKRKLLHALAQSLYLTPRSRAGVAPPGKPPEEEPDEMESLLSEGDETIDEANRK